MNQFPTPSEKPESTAESLAKLLAEQGVSADRAQRAIEQLSLLARSVAPEAAVARAIESGLSAGAAQPAALTPQAWLARLIASLDEVADALTGALSGEPQPVLAGVRRAADPDRFRIDRTIGSVSFGVDCERLPQAAGWRVMGHVGGDEAPPASILVRLSSASSQAVVLALDDLAMFECTLPVGTYTVSLVHEAQEAPVLANLVLP